MYRLACAICLISSPIATHAATSPKVATVLQTYFDPQSSRSPLDMSLVSALPATREVLQEILTNIRRRLESKTLTDETRARADRLMPLLGTMAANAAAENTSSFGVQMALAADATALLHFYGKTGPAQNGLLAVFDYLYLWNPGNLWFFLSTGPTNINRHALRISQLIPKLNFSERRLLLEHLRQFPQELAALCLIVDLDLDRHEDVIRLLQLSSLQFARAIYRAEAGENLEPSESRLETFESYNLVIADTLLALSNDLSSQYPPMLRALEEAIDKAQRQKEINFSRKHRLLFFKMLQERSLDWIRRDHWLTRALAEGDTRRALDPRERFERQGANIIKVDFARAKLCQDLLDD